MESMHIYATPCLAAARPEANKYHGATPKLAGAGCELHLPKGGAATGKEGT